MNNTVVAGVDGSAESLAAARYAAAMARRRGRPLTLVHGFLYPVAYGSYGAAFAVLPDLESQARALLDAAAATVREAFPDVPVHCAAVPASGQLAVIEAADSADVVVVGHRGLGGFPELVLGSVSSQVAAHARGPVVVFRPAGTTTADAPVVVGVDASPEADAALGFAFEEAAGRGVPLEAVHVHAPPAEGPAEALLDAALAPWTAKHPDVTVRRRLTPVADLDGPALRRRPEPAGNAESVFVEASRRAALVVVGSRGRGGFTGLLLGSVSQALVHHADCPVAVVHARESDR